MGISEEMKEPSSKGRRVRKALCVVGVGLLSLWILFLVASFFAPKVAKGYVTAHAKEWIGRRVEIGDISFNPFRFSVSVRDFSLFEGDDETRFVAFREFFVNADPLCLFKGDVCLSEVRLDSPEARIVKNGGLFNFSDILARFSSADSAALGAESPAVLDSAVSDSNSVASDSSLAFPFGISIRNFSVLSGNVVFEDQSVNSHIGVRDFSVKVPEVYFSNRNTSAGVHLDFADGGSLEVDADYNMQKGDFRVDVDLKKFSLAMVKPYLEGSLNFRDLTGFTTVKLGISGNVSDVLASAVSGTVSVDDVVLTETSGKEFKVSHVGVGVASANLAENRFDVDSVTVRGAALHFDLNKNSNNLSVLLSPSSAGASDGADSVSMAVVTADSLPEEKALPDSASPEKKLRVSVGRLSVSGVNFTLNDNTIPGKFSYGVSGISVAASDVTLDERTRVGVEASLPHGGSFRLTAAFNPSDLNSFQANVSVKNVDIRDFSKYAEHYTGYPLSAGRLAFASDNVLQNGEIDSRNSIDIYDLTVGDKLDGAKPEFNVPMKVALYILKDKDGKIAFDVPVKGNVRDPEFSYGKIIWQTVMNLMVKVALSPAKLLLGSSTPSEFSIGVAADDLTSEQYDLARKWTEVLTSRPGSSLSIIQDFQPKRLLDTLARALEKLDYYKASTGKTILSPVDRKAALEADADSAFEAFSGTWTRPSDAELLETLRSFSDVRNEKLLKFLQAQPGVNGKNLKVRTATAAERASAGKKVVFRMSVELP